MIKGRATPEHTARRTARFSEWVFASLGGTGLRVSRAGFGCYRVALGVASHQAALSRALRKGVNLIDTSANYADGLSERLVGQTLGQLIDDGELCREEVAIVSKAGYLQGQNYMLSQERKGAGAPFPDLVEYDEGLEHCIHPEFLEDQLTRSLERLGCETIDVYLLHNPEYYLTWAARSGMSREQARAEYYPRIGLAFAHLEREAARGRIGWYGVSSNTFPVDADRDDFTSLDQVWRQAETLGPDHRFGVIQFPMNLLERGAALTVNQSGDRALLALCRDLGLGTLVNRPLNAMHRQGLLRLADVDAYVPADHPMRDGLARQEAAIKDEIARADADWAGAGSLSQMALRALVSEEGVDCALVGMRHPRYVDDATAELGRGTAVKPRESSWARLRLG